MDLLLCKGQSIQGSSIVLSFGKPKDFFDWESFKIGHIDVLDVIALDDLALVAHQVAQVINGHGIVGAYIGSALSRQKAVHLQKRKDEKKG